MIKDTTRVKTLELVILIQGRIQNPVKLFLQDPPS